MGGPPFWSYSHEFEEALGEAYSGHPDSYHGEIPDFFFRFHLTMVTYIPPKTKSSKVSESKFNFSWVEYDDDHY